MPGRIGVCQDVYEYARTYTSMPGRIRVCQDVYEYAKTYTSMPGCIRVCQNVSNKITKSHTICKDPPLEQFVREFLIVRIDPSRLPSIVERIFIQPSFI